MLKRRIGIVIFLLTCLLFSSCKNEKAENTTSEETTTLAEEGTTKGELQTSQDEPETFRAEQGVVDFAADDRVAKEYKYKAKMAYGEQSIRRECIFVFKQIMEDKAYIVWEMYDSDGVLIDSGDTLNTANWENICFVDFKDKDINYDGNTDFYIKVEGYDDYFVKMEEANLEFLFNTADNGWHYKNISRYGIDDERYFAFDNEFEEAVYDNPIDKADKEADRSGSIQEMIDVNRKFEDIWWEEMEYSYNMLYALLDDKDRQTLEQSQLAWEDFLVNRDKFNEVFYRSDNKYYVTYSNDRLFASDLAEISARYRTLELKEYYYRITGEISFKYEGEPYKIEEYASGSGIVINYPQLTGENFAEVNKLIYEEALYVLKYYGSEQPEELHIDANVTYLDDKYISIVYEGVGRLNQESNKNFFEYTTNINLDTQQKMHLKDFVSIDEELVVQLLTVAEKELYVTDYEYLANFSHEQILEYLSSADLLNLPIEQQKDIFSYITEDKIGIVFSMSAAPVNYFSVELDYIVK